jgi:hypothetical protein
MTEHGPKWLGIGAQRCGTTWFTGLLIQHPQVDVGLGKYEHHVLYRFGLMREWNDKAKQRYQKTFASEDIKLGEFTPYYLRSAWTPEIALDVLPEDAPLIVLLRDPVDRFASSLRHAMGTALKRHRKFMKASKEEASTMRAAPPRGLLGRLPEKLRGGAKEPYLDRVALATDENQVLGEARKRPYIDRTWLRFVGSDVAWGGMYAAQLDAWTAVFPKDRFIVIQYEKLRRDPQQFVDLVWKRIGVDPVPLQEAERKRGATKAERWSPDDHPNVVRGLQKVYRADAERLAAEWDIDLSLWKRTMNPV